MTTGLRIHDLRVSFADPTDGRWRPVVEGVSLEVRAGECAALVGESGSGKSVTALSVCRLIGEARVEGRILLRQAGRELDLAALRARALERIRGRRVAYVFQDPDGSLDPLWRIGDQLAEARLAHGLDGRRQALTTARTLLERVRIRDAARVLRAYPHELSGGMKQRVMIAMALAGEPELVIADEPTTALDAITQREILDLVESLRVERGLTVWLVTHDLPLASVYADRIDVMERGRVVETFTPGEPPAHAYTRRLFGAQLAGHQTPKTPIEI